MRPMRGVAEEAVFAVGPVLAWRTWGLSGRDGRLRLRPTWGYGKPWPARRPAVAMCPKRRRHAPPVLGCTCGLYGVRAPELMQRTRSPAVIGTVSLWGTVVEHTLGFRAQLAYPQTLRLVCPVCFFQHGVDGSREPEIVVSFARNQLLPLCGEHRTTASDVGLPGRSTLDVEDARAAVLDTYRVRPLTDSALERTG